MDILLSAVLGELTTRSINFFISKYFNPPELDVKDRLCLVLLRAQIIVDEATGRNVTNQAMQKLVEMLRHAVHRGYYKLDSFRYQYHDTDEVNDQMVSHYSLFSKASAVKQFCFFRGGTSASILEELKEVLDSLSSMILEANELVMFLKSYPRLYRQPYSMHLLLGNCMFGRQMETQLVINFLMHRQPHGYGTEQLEVLPIVGPGRVGKSTLVAHVCNDERIRDQFSQIVFLSDHDLRDENLPFFIKGCAMEYQNCRSSKGGRLLVVVELDGELAEDEWKKLCSASRGSVTNGTKIIITSRSDKIVKLGTTGVITLKYLPTEAYWYYFKVLTFGSTDPEQHPRFTYLAMEIDRMINNESFVGANVLASFLRDNFDIKFWCKVLAFLRGYIQKHISTFGEHPIYLMNQNRLTHLGRMGRALEYIIVYDQYRRSLQEEVPNITLQDVVYGSIRPHGKFEVLGWTSRIPPYYSLVYTCEIQDLKTTAAKRKRSS